MYLQTDTEARTVREAWSEYIAREVSDCRVLPSPEARTEVIRAVATYCEEISKSGPVRSELIPQLYRRAVASLEGKCDCSEVEGDLPEVGDVEGLPSALRELMAIGWFRPLGGCLRGQGRNWLLEANRFAACRGGIELRFFRELKDALEAISPVWEYASGAGTLALRGLRPALSGITGRPARAGELANFILETRSYCEDHLAAIAGRRHWNSVPAVAIRDLQ